VNFRAMKKKKIKIRKRTPSHLARTLVHRDKKREFKSRVQHHPPEL
jgi:hypothetical protein